ncbi:hypothetical protein [Mycobacterium sp. D16R24]|uniref:hypothetical protein n=1 Tax=Mycobacterium sp. D16R24 TaxID=1855656 RepID=UPI001116E98D|nr:hypothetical protein [Mycobacterium sp. D16R24]
MNTILSSRAHHPYRRRPKSTDELFPSHDGGYRGWWYADFLTVDCTSERLEHRAAFDFVEETTEGGDSNLFESVEHRTPDAQELLAQMSASDSIRLVSCVVVA